MTSQSLRSYGSLKSPLPIECKIIIKLSVINLKKDYSYFRVFTYTIHMRNLYPFHDETSIEGSVSRLVD